MRRAKFFVFFLLFLIFFLNTFHEEYPDEYDSLVGGLYITQGKIPYKDWFQHHQPGAYLLAALTLPFSGISFVKFRIVLSLFYFALNFGVYLWLKKKFSERNFNFYLPLLFIIALSATYFWGQMLLADTLASYLILPAYVFLFLKGFYKEKFTTSDLTFFSFLAFAAWFTSMSYIYLLGGLYLYAFYLYFISQIKQTDSVEPIKKNLQILIKPLLILGGPFILFFLYLLISRTLKDWYFANIIYNQYYIYNYPGHQPGQFINPLRYAIVIAHNFFDNFFPVLVGIKNFSFSNPFNVTLALSNASLFIYLLLKKRYFLIFPFLTVLIYSNVRSNPLLIKETDYQASVYILSSFFNGVFAFFALRESLDKESFVFSKKIIASLLFLLLGIYWVFNSFFISLKFFQKFYAKYMGQAPLIYDRPQVAPIINQLVKKDEYAWVGPFDFKELFYLKAKVPSKYHWFLQHAASIEKIKGEMILDFEKNKALVIVFKRNYSPWGGNPAGFNYFFVDFLEKNYVQLGDLGYKWKRGNPRDFNLIADFNFAKEKKEEILQRLLKLDLIEKR